MNTIGAQARSQNAPRPRRRGASRSQQTARRTEDTSVARRLRLIFSILALLLFAIIARLVFLQVIQKDSFNLLAEAQHLFFANLSPQRGEILMRDKFSDQDYIIATNEKMFFLYAVPRDIEDVNETVNVLKDVLNLSDEEQQTIRTRLEKKNVADLYEPMKHFVSFEQKEQIEEHNIEGLRFVEEYRRLYPEGELAAHVIGFVSTNDEEQISGQYGIEEYYNDILLGRRGKFEAFLDTAGNWITSSRRDIESEVNGDDLVLTIDRTIQFIVEQELKKGVEEFEAESGEIIVQNPHTGAIVAMASYPTYNPNEYSKVDDIGVFLNGATQATYEPGSVIKPFTAAVAIDKGVAEPETTYVDTGSVSLNGWTIRNSDGKANGVKTLTEVLELSLNTGTIHFQQLAGLDAFEQYFRAFGFGDKTGIDLAGEVGGNLDNLNNKKSGIGYGTISYGQGMATTPVGLLTSFSSLVNGGVLYKPYVVEERRHPDGSSTVTEPYEAGRVIDESTSRKLNAMMASVVKNGHAQNAQVNGYNVGGKTGTANIPGPGGYTNDTNHTFLGFGTLEDPEFTVLVRYNKPTKVQFSASSAAVSFQRVTKYLLEYYGIPPTEDVDSPTT